MSAASKKIAPPQRRAVLYVRISDDPEGLEKGVDRQEQDCRAFAEAHNMVVVEGLTDPRANRVLAAAGKPIQL
jgi:hypothetical protein